jgi:hypothetical protein
MRLRDAALALHRGLAILFLQGLFLRENRERRGREKARAGSSMQLWDFPYVKVRVSCACGYRTAYKLVRLGELYGARTDIGLVMECLMRKCPRWGADLVLCKLRCGLNFTDMKKPPPVLRLVK